MYRVLAKDGQIGSMTGRSGFHSGSSVIISESGPACMSMSRVDVMAIAINDFSAGSNTKCPSSTSATGVWSVSYTHLRAHET